MSSQQDNRVSLLHIWLCICMFLSGFSALVYEIGWLRLMSFTLGNTAYATSCALGVFLSGLAIGAYVGGRLADRLNISPLKSYAIVELGIALSAAAVSPVLVSAPSMILTIVSTGSLGHFDPVALMAIYSCLLLFLPTVLMGATLPFVLKQIGAYAPPQKSFGHLYGLNTLGAVFGSLAAAFLGFGYLGIYGTIIAAALINCFIGLVSFVGSFFLPPKIQPAIANTEESDTDKPSVTAIPFPLGLVCLLAFSSGYSTLTFEIVWVKLLRFFNSSLTYSFTVMIGTFLLGLALGSLIYEKVVEKKDKTIQDKLLRFANLQYLAFIASGGCLIGIPICLLVSAKLSRASNIFTDPYYLLMLLCLNSIICILLPATLLGMLFPLLGTIAASAGPNKFASRVGIVYAVNTIGCVLGSIVSGLILIPLVGSYDTFQLAILLGVICTAWVVYKSPNLDKNKKLLMTLLPVSAALVFYLFVKYPLQHFFHATGTDRILFYGEDTTGTMFVTQSFDYDSIQLTVNGACLATTAMPSRRYMRMLGHLPVLLHPNPQHVMIACFGTGTTAGAVSVHPEVKSLDIVELSRLIIKIGDFFSTSNHNVLKNPKTKVHISDARHSLLSHQTKFDVISLEPPPPVDAGIVNLYTTEFYKLVSTRLNDDGVFAQWMPTHEPPKYLWKMMLQSALKVFPYASIWLPNSSEAILVASKSPLHFDIAQIRKRISASEAVKASLKEVGFDDPEAILSTYIMSGDRLSNFAGDVPVVSDDRPALEFFLPYLGPFLLDKELIACSSPGIPDIVTDPADVNLDILKRHRDALILCLTMDYSASKEKKMQLFDQIDRLDPGNNLYRFMRKWIVAE